MNKLSDFNDDYTFESITNTLNDFYYMIEAYLENIFNSPSTINRLLPYYNICLNPDEPNKHYMMFNGTVVKKFELILPKTDLWEDKE